MPHLQGGKIMRALSRLLPWFLRVAPAGDTGMTFLPRGRLGAARRAGWSGRLLLLLLALSTLMARPVAAAATPKGYAGLFEDDAVAVLHSTTNRVQGIVPVSL